MKSAIATLVLSGFLSASALAAYSTPVRVVEQPVGTTPSKEPVNFFSVISFANGAVATSDNSIFTVPLGKRFVLEYVSASTAPTSCSFNMFTRVTLTTGGNALGHDMPIAPSYSSSNNFRRNLMSAQVQLYGDPGTSVHLLLNRSVTTCSSVVSVKFSGYLEDDF
ncbi:MAG: hypothetical protein H6955_18545 [Chromatiaceae bacterium]|nr:hypothetical protein [Chromatiaceae bacterium]